MTDSSSDEEQFDQHQEDTILYPYPKYHDEADVEAHGFPYDMARQPCLTMIVRDKCRQVEYSEFGLSLEGKLANWYSQHETGEFETFKLLAAKFIRLCHRNVLHWEFMSQFYAISQETLEIVP